MDFDSLQEVLVQFSQLASTHAYLLDNRGAKVFAKGNPSMFFQFVEKEPAYKAWQKQILSEREDYAIMQDPSGLQNIVLPLQENGVLVCCIIVGPFRCTKELPRADEETRAFAHALPIVSRQEIDQEIATLRIFMSGVLPAIMHARESAERIMALQAGEEYLNDVLFVLDFGLLVERSLDFFVHKLKLGNCAVRTSQGTYRYHANPALLAVYERAEVLLARSLHNMSGFLSLKDITKDPALKNVSGIDKLPRQIFAANIPDGIMILYADEGLAEKTPLAYALMQKFCRAIEKSKLYMQAQHQSMTDALTGVHNRGFFSNVLREALQVQAQNPQPLHVCMLDVDNFKKYNDTHGHLAGDKALQQIAAAVTQSIGEKDVFARYGGEEFVLLFTNISEEEAVRKAQVVRAAVAQNTELTVSIGLASTNAAQTAETLLEAADKALYEAKRTGKNKVVNVVL